MLCIQLKIVKINSSKSTSKQYKPELCYPLVLTFQDLSYVKDFQF